MVYNRKNLFKHYPCLKKIIGNRIPLILPINPPNPQPHSSILIALHCDSIYNFHAASKIIGAKSNIEVYMFISLLEKDQGLLQL